MLHSVTAAVAVPKSTAAPVHVDEDGLLNPVRHDVGSHAFEMERLLGLCRLVAIRLPHELVDFLCRRLFGGVALSLAPAPQIVFKSDVLDPAVDVVDMDATVPDGHLAAVIVARRLPRLVFRVRARNLTQVTVEDRGPFRAGRRRLCGSGL